MSNGCKCNGEVELERLKDTRMEVNGSGTRVIVSDQRKLTSKNKTTTIFVYGQQTLEYAGTNKTICHMLGQYIVSVFVSNKLQISHLLN